MLKGRICPSPEYCSSTSHPCPLIPYPYGKPSSSHLLRSFQTFRDIPKQVVIRAVQDVAGIEVRFVMSVSEHRPVRAKGTIFCTHNHKVLLVRTKGAKWKFPSGALAAGEAPIVAEWAQLTRPW